LILTTRKEGKLRIAMVNAARTLIASLEILELGSGAHMAHAISPSTLAKVPLTSLNPRSSLT